LGLSPALRRDAWLGYGFAAASFLVALLLRRMLDGSLPPGFPYLTFFPAIILTSFLAGTRPAILCALLSGVAAWYWFVEPLNSFVIGYNSAVALLFYIFIVTVDIAIIDRMRNATERLAAEKEVSASLAQQQRTMFAELQHRVANNLAFVSSLLTLQKRRVAADPSSAGEVFDNAVHRLEVMGRLHRRLHDPRALETPLDSYIRELCADLMEATGAKNIICMVNVDDVRLDMAKLTAMSMLITELMTNSVKHAFTGRSAGTISIDLKRLGDDRLELVVADDGPGVPQEAKVGRSSLGLLIVQSLASQLGGEIALPRPGESATRLAFSA
jgi:two-component sensor histidine kinase